MNNKIKPKKCTKIKWDGTDIYAFFEKDYPLSNWFPCEFYIEGHWWNCSEQFYMW